MLAGLSQSDVASALELTFQQLQKYERGFNRVSASRLYRLSRFFRVPVSVFFEGLAIGGAESEGEGAPTPNTEAELALRSREALMLARYFQNIRAPELRAAIRELAERCASESGAVEGLMAPPAGRPRRKRGERPSAGQV